MGFYHTEEGVSQYIDMAAGYDGRHLIAIFETFLADGARILELGSGPGVDFEILSRRFAVTGSDFSDVFLERLESKYPDADLVNIDATTIETDRQFDAIYSNKVLHHLDSEELARSVHRQSEVLLPDGIIAHSFWYGDRVEEHAGMKFHYRNEEFLASVFSKEFEILRQERYTEFEDNDSLLLIGRRSGDA
jgi:trans-aconitate methyltransferase